MDHFDSIALRKRGACVMGAWHDFFVAFDRHQLTAEAECGEEPGDRRVRRYFSFLSVHDESHRRSVSRHLGARKRAGTGGAWQDAVIRSAL